MNHERMEKPNKAVELFRTCWWNLTQPFRSYRSENPSTDWIPPNSQNVDDPTLQKVLRIYEQVENSRVYLEDKARAGFTLIAFLAPLLLSALAFLLTHTRADDTERNVAACFGVATIALLLLAYVSLARAISVKRWETLWIDSVFDKKAGQYRPHDNGYYAGGLLYCAVVNGQINGKIAEFVKAGFNLTGAAVVALCISVVALIPFAAPAAKKPTSVMVAAPVKVQSTELGEIDRDLIRIQGFLGTLRSSKIERSSEITSTRSDGRAKLAPASGVEMQQPRSDQHKAPKDPAK